MIYGVSLWTAVSDAREARAAEAAFANVLFDALYVPGTGGTVWGELWAAAREFSTKEAYAGQPFPYVGTDARCVLCQRNLDEDDRARLRQFDEFVADRASNSSFAY